MSLKEWLKSDEGILSFGLLVVGIVTFGGICLDKFLEPSFEDFQSEINAGRRVAVDSRYLEDLLPKFTSAGYCLESASAGGLGNKNIYIFGKCEKKAP